MTPEIIGFIALWSILGFTFFMTWGVEGNGFDTANKKQTIFVSLLCGPGAVLVLVGYTTIMFIYEAIKYIYNKLGE